MKKFASLLIVALAAISLHAGTYTTLISNLSGTNITTTITGNTNVGYTTNINGVVIAGTTNYYNLAGSLGPVTITNGWWPAAGWSPQANYPNTLYGPYRGNVLIFGGTLMSTGVVTTTLTFAGSVDGQMWQSNLLTWVITPATNQKTVAQYTNYDSYAWPFLALQNWTSANANLTNCVLETSGKPGL